MTCWKFCRANRWLFEWSSWQLWASVGGKGDWAIKPLKCGWFCFEGRWAVYFWIKTSECKLIALKAPYGGQMYVLLVHLLEYVEAANTSHAISNQTRLKAFCAFIINESAADGKQICVSFYIEWRFIFMKLKLERESRKSLSAAFFCHFFCIRAFTGLITSFITHGWVCQLSWEIVKFDKIEAFTSFCHHYHWWSLMMTTFTVNKYSFTVTHPTGHWMFAQNILGRSTNWIFVPLLCSRAEPSTCWIESTKAQTGQQNNIKKGINHAFLCLCHWTRVRGRVVVV